MCEVMETCKRNEYPPSDSLPPSIQNGPQRTEIKKVLSNDDLQDMNQTNFIRDIVMNGL